MPPAPTLRRTSKAGGSAGDAAEPAAELEEDASASAPLAEAAPDEAEDGASPRVSEENRIDVPQISVGRVEIPRPDASASPEICVRSTRLTRPGTPPSAC